MARGPFETRPRKAMYDRLIGRGRTAAQPHGGRCAPVARARAGAGLLLALLGLGCPGEPPTLGPLSLGSSAATTDATSGGSAGETGVESSATSIGTGAVDTSDSGDDSTDTGTPPMAMCGDGIAEGDEECDLGKTNGGGAVCKSDCTLNVCGDGYIGPGEQCDDGNANDDDECSNRCGPASCGDGVVQARVGEECDTGARNSPTGSCLPSCIAASCGDGLVHDGVEACDTADVGGATCQSRGFDEGILTCAANCASLDTSGCASCGNDVLEGSEECDGQALGGAQCSDLSPGVGNWSRGTLSCNAQCELDDSECCSDVPGQQCDGDVQCCGSLQCGVFAVCCFGPGNVCMGDSASCCSAQCIGDICQ